MSNRLYLPNTTQVPNVIFDYWMAILSPTVFKVLLCIVRKTLGWHKMEDRLSKRQIEKLTGIPNSSIDKAIDELCSLSLIEKYEEIDEWGGNKPNTYTLILHEIQHPNIEVDKVSEEEGGGPSHGGGGGHTVAGEGPYCGPTKDTYSKDTKQNKPDLTFPAGAEKRGENSSEGEKAESAAERYKLKTSIVTRDQYGGIHTTTVQSIFHHFLKAPFTTDEIYEAIEAMDCCKTAVSAPLKYLERILYNKQKEKLSANKQNKTKQSPPNREPDILVSRTDIPEWMKNGGEDETKPS